MRCQGCGQADPTTWLVTECPACKLAQAHLCLLCLDRHLRGELPHHLREGGEP
jgi:hypothetical protein